MILDPSRRRMRSQAEAPEVRLGLVEVEEILARGETVFAPLIAERGIAFSRWQETSQAPTSVLADAEQLTQILVSLMDDAIQTTPAQGRISMVVRTDRDRAEIRITDTGLGIDPDHLGAITGRPTAPRVAEAAAPMLARRMGAHLSVTRSPGRGSTYRLILPTCST